MDRKTARTFALATIAFAALPSATAMAQVASGSMMHATAETGPVVSIDVTEEVTSAPDMATVGTGVQTRAMTAREAMRQNAVQMTKLIDAIAAAGIDRKDIQTSGINLSAQYDYNNRPEGQGPRFVGYEASNQVSVKIRRIADAGDVIDRMVAAGATNVNGPSFGISDTAPLLRQAREKAIRTAEERALFYARMTGYRSVRLLSLSETGDFRPPMPMPMMMARSDMAEAKTPVEPGQLATSVTLNMQYVLEK